MTDVRVDPLPYLIACVLVRLPFLCTSSTWCESSLVFHYLYFSITKNTKAHPNARTQMSFRLTDVPRESAMAMRAFIAAEVLRGGGNHHVSAAGTRSQQHSFLFCSMQQDRDHLDGSVAFEARTPLGELIPLSAPRLNGGTAPIHILRLIERVVYTVAKCHKHGVPVVGSSRRLTVLTPVRWDWGSPLACLFLLPPDVLPQEAHEATQGRDVRVLCRWALGLLGQVGDDSSVMVTTRTLLSLVAYPSEPEGTLSATGLLREVRALILSLCGNVHAKGRSPSPCPSPHASSISATPLNGLSTSPTMDHSEASQPPSLDDTCPYIEAHIATPPDAGPSLSRRPSLRRSSSSIQLLPAPRPQRPLNEAPRPLRPEEVLRKLGNELLLVGNGCCIEETGFVIPRVAEATLLNGAQTSDALTIAAASQLEMRGCVERRMQLKLSLLRGTPQLPEVIPFVDAAFLHTFACRSVFGRFASAHLANLMTFARNLPLQGLNSVLLWHATSSPLSAQAIRTEGFDCRLESAAHGHRFGAGTYFTDCTSKALEYSGSCALGGASCPLHKTMRRGKGQPPAACGTPSSDGYHHLFLCSVILGIPHAAKGPCPNLRRPPPMPRAIAGDESLSFDSVVGYGKAPIQSATSTNDAQHLATGVLEQHAHREYVVFERGCAIPLLELCLKCPH